MNKFLAFTYEGFENTNIGDYIQSLAAMQFYSKYITFHRDDLGIYEGEEVRAIMNGWFTHRPENWPPSKKIHPLFVAFHINSTSYSTIISSQSLEYLRQYQPIGCRDKASAEILNKNGVEAYFSSCLTTTLGLTYKKENVMRKGICIVDPVHFVPESGRRLQKYLLVLKALPYWGGIRHYMKELQKNCNYTLPYNKVGFNRLLSIIRSYKIVRKLITKDDLKNAIYLTQYHISSEYPTNEDRFKRAKELLSIYSSSELVITSRIHCALPCLGLETPVIFLRNMDDSEESTCRFAGLLDLLNVISFKKDRLMETKFQLPLKNVHNKKEYKFYADRLINMCRLFTKAVVQ